MIVDALVVLRLHGVGGEIIVFLQAGGDVPDHVLDEHGIFVSPLRDEFLVGALEEGIDLAAGRILHDADEILDPEELPEPYLDGDDAALVVGAPFADLLGAGTQRRHGNDDAHLEVRPPVVEGAAEEAFVFHEALGLRHRRRLLDEIGEEDLHVGRFGPELLPHLLQDHVEGFDVDLPPEFIEDFHEAAHVGPLEMMRQVDVHVDRGVHRLGAGGPVQDDDRVFDPLDAHLGDLDLPVIPAVLDVDHGRYATRALSDSQTVTQATRRFTACTWGANRSWMYFATRSDEGLMSRKVATSFKYL